MKHEIFGISFDHDAVKADTLFDTVRDTDDEVVLVSKETYHHKEDDGSLDFDYKYVIHAENIGEMTGEPEDENKWGIELKLVPMPKSLLTNELSDTAELHDEDEDDVEIIDLVDDGKGVQMGFTSVPNVTNYDAVMLPKLDEAATTVDVINSTRGFYLDRAWNRIGSTGWDLLHHWVGDGRDFIKAAFDRMK